MNNHASRWAALPLRLMLGAGFIYHGFPKVFNNESHQMFVGMLQHLSIPAPAVMAWVVGIIEVIGGVGLITGVLVRPFSILLIIDMLVAMFKLHLAQGFNFMHITAMTDTGPTFGVPGYEVNLLYIAGLLSLTLSGAGALGQGGRRRDNP